MQPRAAPQRVKIGEFGGRPPRPPACGAIFKGVRQSLRDDTNNENAVGRVGNSSYKSIFTGVRQSRRRRHQLMKITATG
jgi:hypothetical protein